LLLHPCFVDQTAYCVQHVAVETSLINNHTIKQHCYQHLTIYDWHCKRTSSKDQQGARSTPRGWFGILLIEASTMTALYLNPELRDQFIDQG
jgi:hypothetical protein